MKKASAWACRCRWRRPSGIPPIGPTQQQLNGVQGQLLTAQSDLKAAQDEIKTLAGELRLERDRRQKLEEIVTKGRK